MDNPSNRLLDRARQKAETEAQYRAARKARKHELVALHNAVVAHENHNKPQATFEIGFKARRIRRDGQVETLPQEFARILKGCEEFITNQNVFPPSTPMVVMRSIISSAAS
ncbi:hypothetical protein JCM19233_2456 [Vibrio astriarenae]|nr:hypothetical protein JCM19233_2456 [Vibrio sp. C7]